MMYLCSFFVYIIIIVKLCTPQWTQWERNPDGINLIHLLIDMILSLGKLADNSYIVQVAVLVCFFASIPVRLMRVLELFVMRLTEVIVSQAVAFSSRKHNSRPFAATNSSCSIHNLRPTRSGSSGRPSCRASASRCGREGQS
jgi:hypothetical protein